MLNLDDYFWSAIEHPTDWLNDRNYEAPEALDIQLLNQHLRALLEAADRWRSRFTVSRKAGASARSR